MSEIYIRLLTYNTEINHIREMYVDLKETSFQLMKYKPRPALIEKNGRTSRVYTGQQYDPKFIYYVEDGWSHDTVKFVRSA